MPASIKFVPVLICNLILTYHFCLWQQWRSARPHLCSSNFKRICVFDSLVWTCTVISMHCDCMRMSMSKAFPNFSPPVRHSTHLFPESAFLLTSWSLPAQILHWKPLDYLQSGTIGLLFKTLSGGISVDIVLVFAGFTGSPCSFLNLCSSGMFWRNRRQTLDTFDLCGRCGAWCVLESVAHGQPSVHCLLVGSLSLWGGANLYIARATLSALCGRLLSLFVATIDLLLSQGSCYSVSSLARPSYSNSVRFWGDENNDLV